MSDSIIPDDWVMPDDWWQRFTSVDTLIKLFKRHVLALLIAGNDNEGEFKEALHTGFLTIYRDQLIWNTAGHVIDDIQATLTSPNFHVSAMRWMDNYQAGGPPPAPVHYRNPPMKSWKDLGIDDGAILIEGLDALSLLESKQVEALDIRNWRPPTSSPEGHYAIGFPGEWIEFHSQKTSDSKVVYSFNADIACLPLLEVERPDDARGDDFWEDPEAFYGEILPLLGRPDITIDSVKGMSGGPILSIQVMPDKRFMYRLIGIQRTWKPSRRVIRAEPIDRILFLLDNWMPSS